MRNENVEIFFSYPINSINLDVQINKNNLLTIFLFSFILYFLLITFSFYFSLYFLSIFVRRR